MADSIQAVLGIDAGTTAVKAMVVAGDGAVLAEAETEHPVSVPRPGWTEQHPEDWWRSTVQAVRMALQSAERKHRRVEITAIGLSGQMHSSVFLDADGEVIRPSILWNDARTSSQCQYIMDKLGIEGLHSEVANLPLEGFTAPKVLWLRDNEPANFARLRTLLLPKDYIRYRLSGEFATEPSDASGTLLFDVRERVWSKAMLEALELDADILPAVVGSPEVSAIVAKDAAAEFGVRPGTPIVGGGADNPAGAVGSGTTDTSVMQVSIGTSGSVVLPVSEPSAPESMNLHTFCHAAPGMWYLMGVVLSAGSSLRWLRDTIAPDQDYDSLTAEAERVAAGADGLLFLPYLTGERTPYSDANARGVFFGLSFAHTRAHLIRAVIEGVCFALRDSLDLMRIQGASPDEVRAIGGGARSRMWLQTLANVFGLPISTTLPYGGAAYGAALLGAVGCGMFSSVQEATRRCIQVGNTIEPDPGLHAAYLDLHGAYKRLYPALRDEFALLSEVTAGQG